jgi:predicted anti-sigma-YlaC factor YlaD
MNDKNFSTDSKPSLFILHNCGDVIAHMGDYLEKDLPAAQRAALEDHLDECPECTAFYASYKHVVQTAAELREPEQELPVDVSNRLRRALNERLGINLPYIA